MINKKMFRLLLWMLIILFSLFFFISFLPHVISDANIIIVLQSGFVNPYATGYSIDLIATWLVLIVLVLHESHTHKIKGGWLCILLGLVPGVVVGWAAYLLLRSKQIESSV